MTAAPAPVTANPAGRSRRFRGVGYLLGSIVALDSLTSVLQTSLPSHADNPLWRETASAFLAQSMDMWVFAGLLLLITAVSFDDRRVLGALWRMGVFGVVLLILVAIVFVRDARLLVGYLPPEQRSKFTFVSIMGVWQFVSGAGALVAIAMCGRRCLALRTKPAAETEPQRAPVAPAPENRPAQ